MSTNANVPPLSDPQINERLIAFLVNQTKRLDKVCLQLLYEKFTPGGIEQPWRTIFSLLYSVEDSLGSFELLARNLKARESYVTARTVFELSVNICFILAKGIEAAERAEQHMLQRAYRDLDRELSLRNQKIRIKWSGKDALPVSPELQRALDTFTGPKGREIREWTEDSLLERLEAIHDKYGFQISSILQLAYLGIYKNASEIAHGTLFSLKFILGLTVPSEALAGSDRRSQFREWTSMLSFALGNCMFALFFALGQESDIKGVIAEAMEERNAIARLCGWVTQS